jgi:hypothetical protein
MLLLYKPMFEFGKTEIPVTKGAMLAFEQVFGYAQYKPSQMILFSMLVHVQHSNRANLPYPLRFEDITQIDVLPSWNVSQWFTPRNVYQPVEPFGRYWGIGPENPNWVRANTIPTLLAARHGRMDSKGRRG